jgi:hypothetical protein
MLAQKSDKALEALNQAKRAHEERAAAIEAERVALENRSEAEETVGRSRKTGWRPLYAEREIRSTALPRRSCRPIDGRSRSAAVRPGGENT